jgi:fibronectin type 3 domain-containing protein
MTSRTVRAIALFALTAAQIVVLAGAAGATGPTCQTTSATSNAYAVKVCLTAPVADAMVSGDISTTTTVNVTSGSSPGLAKTLWSVNGQYLATDFQSPHELTLSTADFADGGYTIGVAAVMRDGFTTPETTVTVTFANGNPTVPTNSRQWTVPPITTRAPSEPFLVAAVGDGAGGETNATNVTNTVVGWNPDLFLYLGDVYDDGTLTEFKNWYGPFFGRVRTVTTPVVGNHEYTGTAAPGYFNYWDNIPHYYSYDANGWHFIAIDSTSNYNKVVPGTPQYDWFADDLAANRSPCTVVFWHHPLYTIGSEDPAPRMQPMWDLMAARHVTLLVTGHDHQYQRWTAMGAGGVVDPNGIVELVAGTGGHSSQSITGSDPRVLKSNKSYGALRLELYGARADVKYNAVSPTATTVVDSSSVTCKGSDGLPPSAPAGLTASAAAGTTADLHWTAAVDNLGVAGYRVYRDGVVVADVGASATTWTDTTTVGATRYTYTMDAVDAAGNRSVLTEAVAVTTGGPDTTAPTVPNGLTATPSPTAVSLTWSASSDNVEVTGYRILRDGELVSLTSSTTYVDADVPADSVHTWAVQAVDGSGNLSAPSPSVTSVRDTIAPSTPDNLRVTSVEPGAIGLAWDAATDNVAVSAYQLYRDGTVLAQTAATSFIDYAPGGIGTTHRYEVAALDAAGNTSPPGIAVDATAVDASPPSVPTDLQATVIGPNRVVLSWSAATDDVGVSGYTVLRNGIALATIAGTTLTDTSALSDTTYSYAVRATDAAGNASALSQPVTVSTPAVAPILPVADTYVKVTSPTTNYGRATLLRVDGDPTTNTYLKFTVSGVSGPVLRARLRIWVSAGSSTGFATHAVTSTSWSETAMTWNTAPAINPAVVSSTGRTTSGSWVTVDVTPLASTNATITVGLTSSGNSSSSYGSRESGATAPQLLLDVAG